MLDIVLWEMKLNYNAIFSLILTRRPTFFYIIAKNEKLSVEEFNWNLKNDDCPRRNTSTKGNKNDFTY